jgi:Lhr-like helicase
MYCSDGHRKEDVVSMRDGTDEIIKTKLYSEIETLEKQYRVIKDYLSETETESLEVIGTLQVFRDTLSKISMHILTLYTLEGQKTKITWNSLFTNIDNALETLRSSARSNPKSTIQLAFDMSEPKIEEVLSYLLTLKKSLQ